MKARAIFQGAMLVMTGVITAAGQQPGEYVSRSASRDRADDQYVEKYVYVTGSNIPRKVKVRRWGTNGADNVAIYGQRDIQASGRATTEGALQTLDPSVSVRHH